MKEKKYYNKSKVRFSHYLKNNMKKYKAQNKIFNLLIKK